MALGEVEAAVLAARQHGVVSLAQLAEVGMSKATVYRRIADGRLVLVQPGVVRHSTHASTWAGRVMAACLSTGGLASHRSAARLWGAEAARGGIVEVTVDDGAATSRAGIVLHRSTQMHLADQTVIQGIPLTGAGRTALDVAGVVRPRMLESIVDALLRLRRTTWPELYSTLLRHSVQGRTGCGGLRRLLAERYSSGPVPLSDWSRRVAHLLVDGGLPRPVLEHRVLDPAGSLLAQVDVAYPFERVAIELQSKQWHLNHRSFEADPARWNQLTMLGWQVYPITWTFFSREPEELCRIVRNALAQRSHPDMGRIS